MKFECFGCGTIVNLTPNEGVEIRKVLVWYADRMEEHKKLYGEKHWECECGKMLIYEWECNIYVCLNRKFVHPIFGFLPMLVNPKHIQRLKDERQERLRKE